MPKLQGFAWHIINIYPKRDDDYKKRKKKKKYKLKKSSNYGINEKQVNQTKSTSYVYKNGKLRKETKQLKTRKNRSYRFYLYEGNKTLRYSCTRGNYTYLKQKSGLTMKIKKSTFNKWLANGRLKEIESPINKSSSDVKNVQPKSNYSRPKVQDKLITHENILNAGDYVIHKIFGEGKVIEVNGDYCSIKFSEPIGLKRLMKNHTSIQLKSDDN